MYISELNKITDLLATVEEAIEYSKNSSGQPKQYIEDSIEALKAISNYLNENAPEYDTTLINETVFYMYKVIEGDSLHICSMMEKVKRDVVRISRLVLKQVNIRWKVLFLPYKASMWTSLASIWESASNDSNCDCTVMPIPYYELDSYGKPKKYCYEDKGYPSQVHITHFKDYDIAMERPDMIFIHNPYDDANNLTRIESKYFSRNLRQYTRMLVYSPYYTLRYYNPEKFIFLCVSPATEYAHKIIVQSERLKEIYIEHGHNSNKLLTLGSPKIDSVVYNMKNPPEVPEEWKDKIKDNHVFLINTHISFFPKYGEMAFEKIQRIIDYFTERGDCIAIWRPHPLTELMLESKSPQYLEDYKRLINYVECDNNGIIDRFSDYSYAFSVSKAMFSTYSSLVTEYMITGKPVYILEKKNKEELNKISPVDYSYNYYYEKEKCDGKIFTDMVTENKDILYERRMKTMEKAFINSSDGSCGRKIYEQLKKELFY